MPSKKKQKDTTNFLVKVRKKTPSKKDFRNVAKVHMPKNVYKRKRYDYNEDLE